MLCKCGFSHLARTDDACHREEGHRLLQAAGNHSGDHSVKLSIKPEIVKYELKISGLNFRKPEWHALYQGAHLNVDLDLGITSKHDCTNSSRGKHY